MSDILRESIDLDFDKKKSQELEKANIFFNDNVFEVFFASFKKKRKSIILNFVSNREFILCIMNKKITKIAFFDFVKEEIDEYTFNFYKDKNNYIVKLKIMELQNGIWVR